MKETRKPHLESITPLTDFELYCMLASVMLITGSPLDKLPRLYWLAIRLVGYGVPLLILLRHLIPNYRKLPALIRDTLYQYRQTLLLPLGLLLLGEMIGALRGPSILYSLWQTASLLFVMLLSFTFYGAALPDPQYQVRRFLRILSKLAMVILALSLPVYLGNVLGWWVINPYIMYTGQMLLNGPFYHANVFGYVLMLAALASLFLALDTKKTWDWGWMAAAGFLLFGLLLSFARGAILGAGVGILGILYNRSRKLATALAIPAVLGGVVLALAGAGVIHGLEFLPKLTLSGRETVWEAGWNNLKLYGPLGIGAGQAESLPNLSTHNLFMEQYGEGGVLTLIGFLAWVILPVTRIRQSRLDRTLAWGITAMMAAELVHGLFWVEFMNGLRYQTLAYAFLWTAMAGSRFLSMDRTKSEREDAQDQPGNELP